MSPAEIVHYKERCWFCHKRKATLLCDFVVGWVQTTIDFRKTPQTCDRRICEQCAIHLGGDTHFCPIHAMEAKQRLGVGMRK